jgi:SH3-like domain-containing protein
MKSLAQFLRVGAVAVACLLGGLALAQENAIPDPGRGPVTNLPLPRFVSLKSAETNVRRGPSLTHRIDWIYKRADLPVQIIAEYENWRRIVDRDGLGGWVHYTLLSGERTVLVDEDQTPVRSRPEAAAPEVAVFEPGVIAFLAACEIDWCKIEAGGYKGWALKNALWGVDADEIRE